MVIKDLIAYGVLIALILAGMAYMIFKQDTKSLQQHIMQTEQTVSTLRDMATTYMGLSPTKDFTGINMASLKAKQLFSYDVTGTGATSTIAMPFNDNILMAIAPTSNNKGYTITISMASTHSYDAVSLQSFEDKINADFKTAAHAITGYTTSGADGRLTLQFAN